MSQLVRCKDCTFWQHNNQEISAAAIPEENECLRYPPVSIARPVLNHDGNYETETFAEYPSTYKDAQCGEGMSVTKHRVMVERSS